MGKYCEICKKGVMSGNLVSHSNRKTRTTWAPNIQTVHAVEWLTRLPLITPFTRWLTALCAR